MLSFSRWKIFLLLVLSVGSLLFALTNTLPSAFLPHWVPQKPIALGLDLKGGVHLLFEIDEKALFQEKSHFLAEQVRTCLRKNALGYRSLKAQETKVTFCLVDEKDTKTAQKILNSIQDTVPVFHQNKVSIAYRASALEFFVSQALQSSIDIIRQRIDETGTKELSIQSQGKNRILLQMPGVYNPQHLKNLIGKTAKLSFQIVEEVLPRHALSSFSQNPSQSSSQESSLSSSVRSSSTQLLPGYDKQDGLPLFYYRVRPEILLTGDMLSDSRVTFDTYNQPQVFIEWNSKGAYRFAQITTQYKGELLGIVLDGSVLSSPVIKEPILGGSNVIHGSFSVQQAQELSVLMRCGSLPAPLSCIQEGVIGPGLGSDSIKKGINATFFGIALVMIIMLVVYKAFGIFANLSLIVNIGFLLSALSFLEATLTLPGLAGIALSMGMAIDANVLINERIKEELQENLGFVSAIERGYKRAFTSILDSNLTTLIGVFIVYLFGKGPVRGCAITIGLGIIFSMFTAISLSRLFIFLWIRYCHPKKIWI